MVDYSNKQLYKRSWDPRANNSFTLGENEKTYRIINKNIGFYTFSQETIENKFEDRYGTDKLNQYRQLIERMKQGDINDIERRVFNLFFNEKTIINKVSPDKVIAYIELLETNQKDKLRRQKKGIHNIPTSEKINEEKANRQFKEIIEEAYGEKAKKIFEKRPGLNLLNIPNTEVFSREITENFREGFVNDLLSYFIEKSDDFIKLTKNLEKLEAFKLYYDRMASQLGENVVTMQMCIYRYDEYSEILKQASKVQLTEEQLSKLDGLVSWPKNICKITDLKELKDLDEQMSRVILGQQDWQSERKFDSEILYTDIFNQNIGSEEIIYDYANLTDEEISELTDQEREIFKLLQKNQHFVLDAQTLKNACSQGIKPSTIFLDKYKSVNKVKEKQMSEFNKGLTNRNAIERAIREKKDNVCKIVIDGVEFIDVGNMQCNFAVHNPYMNNSFVNTWTESRENDAMSTYLTYENNDGMSTISAIPVANGLNQDVMKEGNYVYWDFEDNEIISLMENNERGNGSDGKVSHIPKRVISDGVSNKRIKGYKQITNGSEIAFYRRHRSHERIETEKYGGKIIPDAIIGDATDPEIIKAAQTRFGTSIPIIVRRNALQDEQYIQKIKEAIEKTNQQSIYNQEKWR